MLIQLPNDVKLVGYKPSQKNPYEYDSVYKSDSNSFTGTEGDFLRAGLAYRYIQIDKNTRIEVRS